MVLGLSFSEILTSRKLRKDRPARPRRLRRQPRAAMRPGEVRPRGTADAPPQRLLLSLDVFEDCICLSRWGRGDSVQRRIISAEDSARIFSANLDPRAGDPGPDALPARRIAGLRHELRPWDCVCGWLDADRRQHYVIRCRAHRRKIRVKIAGTWQRLVCRLPDLLAEVVGSVANGRFAWRDIVRVAAIFEVPAPLRRRRGEPTPQAVVYCPPLPNVDNAGDPCMGSVKLDRGDWSGLSPLEVFERSFLETDFADHYLTCSLREDLVKTHRNIVHATRKAKGRVPVEWLRPLGTFAEVFGGAALTPVEESIAQQAQERGDRMLNDIFDEPEGVEEEEAQ